jgi:hypothetical protein
MKQALFIIWAVAIGQLLLWTFAPEKPNAATVSTGDGQPFGYLESHFVESRIGMRKSAMATLDKPWSSRCGDSRQTFINGVGSYYWQRKNQYERYREIHGKPGVDYIAEAWSDANDKRIDRLTREAYANGYLKPSDFKESYARDLIAEIVKDERVTAAGCTD